MPIKINLLAEAQAAEDLRRKDPVKRAIAVAGLVVLAMLLWAGLLYSKVIALRSEQAQLEQTWKNSEKQFNEVTAHQAEIQVLNAKLQALERFHTNRFLWGSALNAFQQTIPASMVDKVQVTRLNGWHEYQVTEAVPAKKKGNKVVEAAKPAMARERITLNIDAKDYGEQNFNRFKDSILAVPFFKELLPVDAIRLTSVSPPARDIIDQREYVQFTLECKLPPVVRNE